jgi:hypothetical protein
MIGFHILRRAMLPSSIAVVLFACGGAAAQVPLEWIPESQKTAAPFPIVGARDLQRETFKLIGRGFTLCGGVERDRGKTFVYQDGQYDRAYFEIAAGTREVPLGGGQSCFIGYLRHKAGKTREAAASELPPATDGYPDKYWLIGK